MVRIAQQHSTLAARFLPRVALAVLVALLLATSAADAALTTGKCLAQKQTAWGDLRKCQATEKAKVLKGKAADLGKCQTKFQERLTKIHSKGVIWIDCRYGNNGDGTVTDFDTGLQWEQKTTVVGSGVNFIDPHDVDNTYTWTAVVDGATPNGTAFTDFLPKLNGVSSDGVTITGCFAGHCDWRLPTIVELRGIMTASTCLFFGNPCIDPIFGPTIADFYWSATTNANFQGYAWFVSFGNGAVFSGYKDNLLAVRAMRAGL